MSSRPLPEMILKAARLLSALLLCAAVTTHAQPFHIDTATAAAAAHPPALAALEAEVRRLTTHMDGDVGVAAVDLASGAGFSVNGDEPFPMASTIKVAIAGAALHEIDSGRLALTDMVAVPQAMRFLPGTIGDNLLHDGIELSVHNLLEAMLTVSDNTAADVMLKKIGGPAVATAWLRSIGVQGQRVDRSIVDMQRAFFGFGPDVPPGKFDEASDLTEAQRAIDSGAVRNPRFDDSVLDTSTPEAMATLLYRIFRGEALSPASTAVITAIMARCQTGPERLLGLLPPGIAIAHKTGTVAGSLNDVGVIELPEGAGSIAIAVFTKKSTPPWDKRERVIAQISRAVFDYYLLASSHGTPDPSPVARLEAEIRRRTAGFDGTIGVSARLLDGGAPLAINAGENFPMASAFKVAVAGAVLHGVDGGRWKLDQMIDVTGEKILGSPVIGNLPHDGVRLSVANLLEIMLTRSDNTAADAMTALAGGPSAVTAWLRSVGISGQQVSFDTAGSFRAFFGLPPGPVNEALKHMTAEQKELDAGIRRNPQFEDGPLDASTPHAMTQLLAGIGAGKLLGAQSSAWLMEAMARCQTGERRLKARLPPQTPVAHKTGTMAGSANDVGVITLPGGKRFALSVFLKKSTAPDAEKEAIIADVGRLVYDYYLYYGSGAGSGEGAE